MAFATSLPPIARCAAFPGSRARRLRGSSPVRSPRRFFSSVDLASIELEAVSLSQRGVHEVMFLSYRQSGTVAPV